MAKLTIVVINYNSFPFLKTFLGSVLNQSYQDFSLVFIDNASPEKDALDFMHQNFDSDERVSIIANTTNKGYSKAANQGIRIALGKGSEFVCIANPDMIFELDYFEKLIGRMRYLPRAAALTGKIYKYDYKNDKPTNVIDTVGLFAFRNRRVIDEGQGVIDEGQFGEEKEVFGVSGACPLYRLSALEDIKVLDEYFDEDFFMYKEDVDLSWRFLLYGWKSIYCPEAVAYHGRGTGVYPRFRTMEIIQNRKHLSRFQKKLSFRNQHLVQSKNELNANFFHDFFPIVLRKLMAPVYITIFEPYLWGAYIEYFKLLPRIRKKRKIIMQNKKISPKEMEKWFHQTPLMTTPSEHKAK